MDPHPRARPQALSNESLTIGELSARSGVAPSALRYYERLGLIRAGRTSGNQRRYDRAELRRVAFIRIAQQVGVALDEIADALASLPDNRTPTRADWGRLSALWRTRLEERIALLEELRDDLSECIGCGCLSMQRCQLYNAGDRLAAEGSGPRLLMRRAGRRVTRD
ncbi:MerR family redox-sensitive transcriptional activator SoxR [Asanoa ferruginea]|uniref:MerR family redox-sensitive transcriptional activator SoxR n=1 Tax=Asanoa ferruginea TaxID=53367 RepID=A0A3D9ZH80_9ACTN|nr:MerR family redox-sensitive transcriptional activator SoxR [Asanoa ferruginea]GIF49363.1 redox-sensitive transcriptional activator SoxR [Asanoa ferruginea]